MIRNPFPGPQPYRTSDRDRFFGREEMSYRLEANVVANGCVTVYGPSGAGKSSLMQASVIPNLIERQEIRVVRVDSWPGEEDPSRWLASVMYTQLNFDPPPEEVSPHDAILSGAKRMALRSSRLLLIYLDQIEQLLYASRSTEQTDQFFACVHELMNLPLRNMRLVFSLREDYLGRFRDRLRDRGRLLAQGFRVGPMTVADLTSAVCKTAAVGDPPQAWSSDEMRRLMLEIRVPGQSASDDAEAVSAYAQIVCRSLFDKRAEDGIQAFEENPEAEPIMRSYLDETLSELGPHREAARRLLEEHLVTLEGTRTLRTERELLQVLPPAELSPVLAALEQAAILHAEEHQGTRYFELGHDWLAKMVTERREEREREEEQRRRDERARARRRVFYAIAAAAAALAIGGVSVWAWQEESKAHDTKVASSSRALMSRGQLAEGMMLLPFVKNPEDQDDWMDLANDALRENVLFATLRGHDKALTAAAFSPDGAYVLTASMDATARVWRADGRETPVHLKGPAGPVLFAAFSPNGERVLTASKETVHVFLASGGPLGELKGHKGDVIFAAWSRGDKQVVSASRDGRVQVQAYDGAGAPSVVHKGGEGTLTCAAFHSEQRRGVTTERVFAAYEDGTVRWWSLEGKGGAVKKGHKEAIVFLAVSPDGKHVLSASRDETARIWSVENPDKEPIVLRGHEGSVNHAAWSPDGLSVATASADGTAQLWKAADGTKMQRFVGHDLPVVHVAFKPDGPYLATASADRTARLWPLDGGVPLVLREHEAPLRSVEWSRDGKQVLTAAADPNDSSPDHTAKIWKPLPLLDKKRVTGGLRAAFFDSTGEGAVSIDMDGRVRIGPIGGDHRPAQGLSKEQVEVAALSPDGRNIVVASRHKTAVYRVGSVQGSVALIHHSDLMDDGASFAVFDPDSTRVITLSKGNTARVWDAQTGKEVVAGALRGHTASLIWAAWSQDGKSVVTTSADGTARVWSLGAPGKSVVLGGHSKEVLAAAFSPDGKRVVTASADETARIWDVDTGKQLGDPLGHENAVLRAVWSRDGKRVATLSADNTVRVWTVGRAGKPIVLPSPMSILDLQFREGGKELFGIGSDGTRHVWVIDIDTLKALLRTAHTDCLLPEARELYLGESDDKAQEEYAKCEISHKRTPRPPKSASRAPQARESALPAAPAPSPEPVESAEVDASTLPDEDPADAAPPDEAPADAAPADAAPADAAPADAAPAKGSPPAAGTTPAVKPTSAPAVKPAVKPTSAPAVKPASAPVEPPPFEPPGGDTWLPKKR